MDDQRGSQSRQGNSNRESQVNPEDLAVSADSSIATEDPERPMFNQQLIEEICNRGNLKQALKRVQQNRGSPGVDGMSVDDLGGYLKTQWPEIKEQLFSGTYHPQPILRVEIPKPGKEEKRKLGIPTVVDRFIQQAILQALQKRWDSTFSEHSYGFRPGRSAHQAIAKAQGYLKEGYKIVVDIDLESFFDRVNHDRLMSHLAQRIADKRVLKLIRAYLKAGIMENGLTTVPTEGTPQGGPLSPFLSNVVLDELDRELEKRGHHFVRYADDCNIYVKSERAGERVMASTRQFITKWLKLRVNEEKSAIDRPQNRKFLGYTFTGGGYKPNRRKIAPESIQRFHARIRQLTRRNQSISLEDRVEGVARYLKGWKGYFGYSEVPSLFRDLDSWIRGRLRSAIWKQWKTYRNRKANLMRLGVSQELAHTTAWSAKGPWRVSHSPGVQIALSNGYFRAQGLPSLAG